MNCQDVVFWSETYVPGTGGHDDIALDTGANEGCSTRLQTSGLPSFPPWSDVSGTA